MKKRYDKILWTIMMYQKVCVKKFEPSSMGQRFIHLLPPGPVQRHSMARLSQWSIFKRGSFIFHTTTLAGARGSTKYDGRHVEITKSRNNSDFNISWYNFFFKKIDVVMNSTIMSRRYVVSRENPMTKMSFPVLKMRFFIENWWAIEDSLKFLAERTWVSK